MAITDEVEIIRETCEDCDAPIEDLTCVDCGMVRYIGPRCGHVATPAPVDASEFDDHEAVCEACEEKRRARHEEA